MPAHITDQFRIINANNFVDSIQDSTKNYYTFLGFPDPTNTLVGGTATWSNNTPNPIDNFKNQNDYHDTMLFFKKITITDVKRVIRRLNWTSGQTYDMYRPDVSASDVASVTGSTNLYESNFYVMNSDYRVYICLQNGTTPDNPQGKPSLDEPKFTDLQPRSAGPSGDGYIWKYLYTITPSDIIKFVTRQFIPVPNSWGTSDTEEVENAAIDGRIETVIINNKGNSDYTPGVYTDIPILGDGTDGKVSIVVNASGQVSSVSVTSGGKNYTKGIINFDQYNVSTLSSGTGAILEVIIPPKGGHGKNIYRELGSLRVMINSVFDNNSAENSLDFITGNNFSRIGIIYNPNTSDSVTNTGTALGAIKVESTDSNIPISNTIYTANTQIKQTVSTGTTATAYVASYDSANGIIKYYQPVGLARSDVAFDIADFTFDIGTGGSLLITGETTGSSLRVANFTGSSETNTITGETVDFGRTFTRGTSQSEIETKYSGDIIYVENRAPVPRSPNQKEDIKIVLEF